MSGLHEDYLVHRAERNNSEDIKNMSNFGRLKMSCCCICLDTQVEFSYIYTSPCEFLSIINISGLFCVENAYQGRRSECPRSISARYQKLNDIFFGSFVKKLKDTNDYFNNILILLDYVYNKNPI